MAKYRGSGNYHSKQQYRSLRDIYRSLQNLYKRIDQLQRYKSSGSSSERSYGYKPRMERYSAERKPEKYTKEKVEPKYVVKTEAPKYRIETLRFNNAEQLAEETEKRIEARFKPILEGIERRLDEKQSLEPAAEDEPNWRTERSRPTDELQALEQREFEGTDINDTREDLEFLLNTEKVPMHTLENTKPDFEAEAESQGIETEPIIPEAIHGTEVSSDLKLSKPELGFDEMDFFALEDELFGMERGIEAGSEDEIERALG